MSDVKGELIAGAREMILRVVREFPRGLTTRGVDVAMRSTGIPLDENGPHSAEGHLTYLESAGLVERVTRPHTAGLVTWKLTAKGDDAVFAA